MPSATPSFPKVNRGHPLAQGLVGAWPLYEGSSQTANDVSGRDNHLVIAGDTVWTGTPQGWGLTNASVAGASVANPPGIQALTELTAAVWVKPSTTGRADYLGIWTAPAPGYKFVLLGGVTSAKFTFFIANTAGTTANSGAGATTFVAGTWYHLAGTFKLVAGGSNLITLYVNGAQDAQGTTALTLSVTGTKPLDLCGSGDSVTVSTCTTPVVYDHALTQPEIAALYQDSVVMLRRRSWRLAPATAGAPIVWEVGPTPLNPRWDLVI